MKLTASMDSTSTPAVDLSKWDTQLDSAPVVRAVGVIHQLASHIAPEFKVEKIKAKAGSGDGSEKDKVRVSVYGIYDWRLKTDQGVKYAYIGSN